MSSDIDVLVAGAGGGGLTSALAAAEAGTDVLLVEGSESYKNGCNTSLSGSVVPAAGTRWQASAGIDDSAELFLADVLRKTHGTAYLPLAQVLTHRSAEVVEWLADHHGVEFELVDDFLYPGYSTFRGHASPARTGSAIHSQLANRAVSHPAISLLLPAHVTQIHPSGSTWSVEIRRPDGSSETVTASNVILATNGFAANRTLLARFIPEMATTAYLGGDGSTGTAIEIAERLNLDLACMTAYQGHGGVVLPHGVHVTWATVMQGAIIVDHSGSRFADETVGYSEFAGVIGCLPGAFGWLILDRRIYEASLHIRNFRELDASGAIRWTDSVSELAAHIGADRLRLEEVLDEVYHDGSPDRFGRFHSTPPLMQPFGAVRVTGGLFHTQGGIAVDERARALRSHEPVPGLYAVGGAAVGISGKSASGYMGGNGLLAAFGLGYLAGRDAGGAC